MIPLSNPELKIGLGTNAGAQGDGDAPRDLHSLGNFGMGMLTLPD